MPYNGLHFKICVVIIVIDILIIIGGSNNHTECQENKHAFLHVLLVNNSIGESI